ncbi:hypothetical protein [Tindallia californiensis]|uniref:Outer membrane efflux protein n=1 Tax=Tindallia californiensis TaxID=159292 RepID=A0A1H3PEA0_9FIRM|nr:hypothetical protein [Tindallia californiensis]SDY99273.1 hypothetical protein SAMN05192546_106159 [Tindallia californiensis]
MKGKKLRFLTAMMLIFALLLTSLMPTWAEEGEMLEEEESSTAKTPLTLEEAIKKAVDNDISLRKRANTIEQLQESRSRLREYDQDTRPTISDLESAQTDPQAARGVMISSATSKNIVMNIIQTDINIRSLRNQKEIEEERIGYILEAMFNDIREVKVNKELLEDRLSYMNTLQSQERLKAENGMASRFSFSQLTQEVERTEKNRDLLAESERILYEQLGIMTGIRNIHDYEAVIELMEYQPVAGTATSTLVSRAVAADPYVEIAELQITKAETDTKFFTYTGSPADPPYKVKEIEVDNAIKERNNIRRNLREVLEERISKLKQLEKTIQQGEMKVKQLEEQLEVLELQYELGMIIRNSITEKELEIKSELEELENLKQQHALLRTQVTKPYLVPEYMQ